MIVRMKSKNDNAAAFCCGSSGARTVNVVAYKNPPPIHKMISNGITSPTGVFSSMSVNRPTPMNIAAQPIIFCVVMSKKVHV